eukprot:c9608_g1_i2.p1 GENE.c9608_g1_i2~~c9608_g1_i2.p1  ORF type:complete len:506 (-),score=72.55 c9608_g1_i2:88-1605(-)
MAYIGLTVACPLAGPVLQKVPTRLILIVSVALNSFCCFLFGLAPSRPYAFLARFGVGFTHSIVVVYNPVWVDCHAPKSFATTWLSFIQASAPLGIMIGYCVSGYLSQVFHKSWRLAFYIQGLALIPPLLVFLFAPTSVLSISDEADEPETINRESIDAKMLHAPRSDASTTRSRSGSAAMVIVRSISLMGQAHVPATNAGDEAEIELSYSPAPSTPSPYSPFGNSPDTHASSSSISGRPKGMTRGRSLLFSAQTIEVVDGAGQVTAVTYSFWQQVKMLWRSTLFVSVVLALSSLYFVVTAVQYWITIYLIDVIHAPKPLVLTAFAVTSLTAPILGVICGGLFIDWMGGYKKFTLCLKILTVFATLAELFALPAGFIPNFWAVIFFLWMTLFFGGCILAPATGIVISAVEKKMMPFASSMSMLLYNLLGYAAGPMVTGLVYEGYGMTWCVRVGLGWGVFGMLGLWVAWYSAHKREKNNPSAEEQTDANLERISRKSSIFANDSLSA